LDGFFPGRDIVVRIDWKTFFVTAQLLGNWRKELLFILRQELNLYQIYQQQIAECDTALVAHLQTLDDKAEPGSPLPPAKANKKAGSNAPSSFDLRGELYRISGTDLTQIDGIRNWENRKW
jgi:transposase